MRTDNKMLTFSSIFLNLFQVAKSIQRIRLEITATKIKSVPLFSLACELKIFLTYSTDAMVTELQVQKILSQFHSIYTNRSILSQRSLPFFISFFSLSFFNFTRSELSFQFSFSMRELERMAKIEQTYRLGFDTRLSPLTVSVMNTT